MIREIVVATRNPGKLREIREIARAFPSIRVRQIPESIAISPAEDELEQFDTFRENALAKARFFAEHLKGEFVLAEDSGLCVEALGGAPGVQSRRFAGRADLSGADLDRANNELLLAQLRHVPAAGRTAAFVGVAALREPDGAEVTFTGSCDGRILEEPAGHAGFGYDPLFFVESEGCTFAELPPERKNQISHRAKALRQAFEHVSSRA